MILARSVSGSGPDKLSGYAYEDTRRLVALVEEAATLMEQKGEDAFVAAITETRVRAQGARRRPDFHCGVGFFPGHANLDERLGGYPIGETTGRIDLWRGGQTAPV